MAESVLSQTSTSSSSGGGSLHLEPPGGRENFPPSNHRRFSRSSADDDDSDPCMSYPYLPLDESPDSLMSRRHSLPFTITYYDEDMFVLVRLAKSNKCKSHSEKTVYLAIQFDLHELAFEDIKCFDWSI